MPCAIGPAGWALPPTAPTRVRSIWRAMSWTRRACGPRPRRAAAPASKSACFPPIPSATSTASPVVPAFSATTISKPTRVAWRWAFFAIALARGAGFYAPVEALAVEPHANGVTVLTDQATIRARHVVFATGYELPKGVPRKGHRIATTWAIATRPQPRGLWPGHGFIWEASDPYLYLRVGPARPDHLRWRRRDVQRRRDARRPQRGKDRRASKPSWPSCCLMSTRAPTMAGAEISAPPPPARRRSGPSRA